MALGAERAKNGRAGALIASAWQLRWRAPELSRLLSERAAELAVADGDEHTRLRAETMTLFALNRLGQGVVVAERAVASLRAAEALDETELAWRLRVELANAARVVGAPLTGFSALRPVLEAGAAPKALRAAAMVQLVDCLAHLGTVPELTDALTEADQLYGEDPALEPDVVLVLRGLLRSVASALYRRWGDLPAAVLSAREGLALLDGLSDASADSGHARGRLVLQLVCALLDSNRPGEARAAAHELLERPVRAPVASSAGWIRLALATRLYLPSGQPELAVTLLGATADSAQRHGLEPLLAESLTALAHVHEVSGDYADALSCLRTAYAAERRRQRAVNTVRLALLEQLPATRFQGESADGLREQVTAVLRRGRVRRDTPRGSVPRLNRGAPEIDDLTGLLNHSGFRRQLDAAVNGATPDQSPVTLVLVDVGGTNDEHLLRTVADRLRDTAPHQASVARVGGEELAVLLPGATQDQAQRWAEQLRTEVADLTPGHPVNTGVAQHRPGTQADVLITEADRALARAKLATAPRFRHLPQDPAPGRRSTHRALTGELPTIRPDNPGEAPAHAAPDPTPHTADAAETQVLPAQPAAPEPAASHTPESRAPSSHAAAAHAAEPLLPAPEPQAPPAPASHPAEAQPLAAHAEEMRTRAAHTAESRILAAHSAAPALSDHAPTGHRGTAQPETPHAVTFQPTADPVPSGRRAAPDPDPAPTGRRAAPEPSPQAAPGRRAAPDPDADPAPTGRRAAPEQAPEAPGEASTGRRAAPDQAPAEVPGHRTAPEQASAEAPESASTGRRTAPEQASAEAPESASTGRRAAPEQAPEAPGEASTGRRAAPDQAPAEVAETAPTGRRAAREETPAEVSEDAPAEAPDEAPAGRRATPEAAPEGRGRSAAAQFLSTVHSTAAETGRRFGSLPPAEEPELGTSEPPLFFEAPTAPQPVITDDTPRPDSLTGPEDEPAPAPTPEPAPAAEAEPEAEPEQPRRRRPSLAEALDFDWSQALRDSDLVDEHPAPDPEPTPPPAPAPAPTLVQAVLPPAPRDPEPEALTPEPPRPSFQARLEPEPSEEPQSERRSRGDAKLAELLAEALAAYESGRHEDSGTSTPEPAAEALDPTPPPAPEPPATDSTSLGPPAELTAEPGTGTFADPERGTEAFADPEPARAGFAEPEPSAAGFPDAEPPRVAFTAPEPTDTFPVQPSGTFAAPEAPSAFTAPESTGGFAAPEPPGSFAPEPPAVFSDPEPPAAFTDPEPSAGFASPEPPADSTSPEPLPAGFPPAEERRSPEPRNDTFSSLQAAGAELPAPSGEPPAVPGPAPEDYPLPHHTGQFPLLDFSTPDYGPPPADGAYPQPMSSADLLGKPATGFHRAVPVEASAMPSRASASAYLPVPAELQGEFTGRCGPEITGEPDPFAASDEDPFGYARAMDATASASVLPEPPSYPDVEDPTEPQPRITDAPRDQAWTLPGRDGSPG